MAYNDGNLQNIVLDTKAPLDTANPPTDRDPGVLLEATDLHHRYWGPRKGGKQIAWPHNNATPPTPAPLLMPFDYASVTPSSIVGHTDAAQRDLGTKWTCDIVFRLANLDSTAGADVLSLFRWICWVSGANAYGLQIGVYNTAHASAGKVYAKLTTTATPGTATAEFTLTGATTVTTGAGDTYVHHIRVVRDGVGLYVYLDGTLDVSSTSLTSYYPTQGPTSSLEGYWSIGRDATDIGTPFTGDLYYICLRDGAFRTGPISPTCPVYATSPVVRLLLIPSVFTQTSTDRGYSMIPDYSIYEAHGEIKGLRPTPAASTSFAYPKPIQGIGSWYDMKGVSGSAVMSGGVLYWRRKSDG